MSGWRNWYTWIGRDREAKVSPAALYLDKDEDEHDVHHGGVELEAHVARTYVEDTAEDTLVSISVQMGFS